MFFFPPFSPSVFLSGASRSLVDSLKALWIKASARIRRFDASSLTHAGQVVTCQKETSKGFKTRRFSEPPARCGRELNASIRRGGFPKVISSGLHWDLFGRQGKLESTVVEGAHLWRNRERKEGRGGEKWRPSAVSRLPKSVLGWTKATRRRRGEERRGAELEQTLFLLPYSLLHVER